MSSSPIKFAAICPHPPIIVPTIGSSFDLKKVSKTISSMKKLAKIFAQKSPETIIIISPHGPIDFNQFIINQSPILIGHFYNFGDFQTELIFKNNLKLINQIEHFLINSSYKYPSFCFGSERILNKKNFPLKMIKEKELDHGTLVPLFYLSQKHSNFKVVPISYSFLDLKTHFQFGKTIQKIIANFKITGKIGIVASGDLSHRLTQKAPAGYSPRAKEFDQKLIELLKKKDMKGILKIDPTLVEEAGECGYRSIIILLGILSNIKWEPEIFSYQAPFGVGYLVMNFNLE